MEEEEDEAAKENKFHMLVWMLAACIKRMGGTVTFTMEDDTNGWALQSKGDDLDDGVTVRLIDARDEKAGHA